MTTIISAIEDGRCYPREINRGQWWPIGEFIRKTRLKSNLRQNEMAKLLGFRTSQLGLCERGDALLAPKRALEFCKITKTDPSIYAYWYALARREEFLFRVKELSGGA